MKFKIEMLGEMPTTKIPLFDLSAITKRNWFLFQKLDEAGDIGAAFIFSSYLLNRARFFH